MSNYFSYLPDLQISERTTREASLNQNIVKNIFRRVSVRDDLQKYIFAYEDYVIQDRERPDNVSTKFYDTPEYDWVIILCNRYTNIMEEWPMDVDTLDSYLERKYGADLYQVVQYETNEILDSKGDVILKKGLVVNENFIFTSYEGRSYGGANAVYPLTRYEIEVRNNEQKRNIKVLKRQFLQNFIEEFEELIKYPDSKDRVDKNLKNTQVI